MSSRSIVILATTGLLLCLMVVLVLVPPPEGNFEAAEAVTARIQGALGILFPASLHSLGVDLKSRSDKP